MEAEAAGDLLLRRWQLWTEPCCLHCEPTWTEPCCLHCRPADLDSYVTQAVQMWALAAHVASLPALWAPPAGQQEAALCTFVQSAAETLAALQSWAGQPLRLQLDAQGRDPRWGWGRGGGCRGLGSP